jgi:hypothetical protein
VTEPCVAQIFDQASESQIHPERVFTEHQQFLIRPQHSLHDVQFPATFLSRQAELRFRATIALGFGQIEIIPILSGIR